MTKEYRTRLPSRSHFYDTPVHSAIFEMLEQSWTHKEYIMGLRLAMAFLAYAPGFDM